jgi:hypothetical protein
MRLRGLMIENGSGLSLAQLGTGLGKVVSGTVKQRINISFVCKSKNSQNKSQTAPCVDISATRDMYKSMDAASLNCEASAKNGSELCAMSGRLFVLASKSAPLSSATSLMSATTYSTARYLTLENMTSCDVRLDMVDVTIKTRKNNFSFWYNAEAYWFLKNTKCFSSYFWFQLFLPSSWIVTEYHAIR